MQIGGVVLCGGKSSRMGYPKALLPFGPELMLQRVVRILGELVSPLVVVAARDQELPTLPNNVLLARDEHPERGPLEGLRGPLAARRTCGGGVRYQLRCAAAESGVRRPHD